MERNPKAASKKAQVVAVERVIVFTEEAGAAVIAALDDVIEDLREVQAGTSRHEAQPLAISLLNRC